MGPNNLCCVTRHFLLFCSVSYVIFIRILLRHVTLYFTYVSISQSYFIRLSCQSSSSIKFQRRFYNFIRFWRHFLQFLSRPTSNSTAFKVAVSHFVFYPCGALLNIENVVKVHRMQPKWTRRIRQEKYPIYAVPRTTSPKYLSVSLYDQPFSRYFTI